MKAHTKQEQIFFDLYDSEVDALFRFISFRLADREQVKDIIQESFLRMWKTLSTQTVDNPRAYLYRIARNQLIDTYRRHDDSSLEALMEEGFDRAEQSPLTTHEQLDLKKYIDALKEIGEQYREVLWLRFVEGWMVKDIAESLQLSENVVSVRIHRGLKAWRAKIDNLK